MKIFEYFKNCFSQSASNSGLEKEAPQESKQDPSKNAESKYINIDDFAKLDLRAGKIIKAELVEGSNKLIKCEIDFGEPSTRIIVSGIAKYRKPEELEGKTFLYITNLEPRKIFGIESQGMLVALHDTESDDFAMLVPDSDIKPGTKAG